MAFIPLRDFLSIWHFKLIGLIGLRAVSERVNYFILPKAFQGKAKKMGLL
jgi:hypothetical protein